MLDDPSQSMAHRRERLELKIVLETSAIWADGESHLLRREIAELIDGNRGDAHLSVQWCLPGIVMQERIYQMQREAATLLPSLTRLERVIGHPLNITEDITSARINETVQKQIDQHQLVTCPIAYDGVDLARLIADAVNRRPPFDKKTEKGFRDAIIVETFHQLVAASPVEPRRCRVVLLTNDALLAEAARTRTAGRDNVQIFASADELLGLINTLMSTVSEEYVARLKKKAGDYFFQDPTNKTGVYYDLDVRNQVEQRLSQQLTEKPATADRRANGKWLIASPRFVRKDRQRVYWASRISIEATAYKRTLPSVTTVFEPQVIRSEKGALGLARIAETQMSKLSFAHVFEPVSSLRVPAGTLQELSRFGGTERTVATGKTILDVNWSASVSVRGNFSKPRLESIEFVETAWEESE